MRVSTQQFYFQNAQQLSNKQSDVNNQIEYISSGKRVLTAQDDAVAYTSLAGYKTELANIEKYQRNITQAQNRNSFRENTFASAEDVMQQFKQLFIQARNGTLSDVDLKALAELGRNSQAQMLDLANSKDETGGYVFSGYQIDKKPFAQQIDGSVIYQGDNGVRQLQIAKNVLVDINEPGDSAFDKVLNADGDFTAKYNTNTSGISITKAAIVDRGAYNAVANPPDYNFSFTSSTDLTVTDNNGAVVFNTASYVPGQIIAFNGVEVQLNGKPLPGDDFDLTPQEHISIFDTINNAIKWMEQGSSAPDSVIHAIEHDKTLGQLEAALNHMTSMRVSAGVNQKLIENQGGIHSDNQIYLSKGQSVIEDLDFASAVANFEQSKVALQAAQQTFSQLSNMSLFNYL